MNKTILTVKGITMYWTIFIGALGICGILPLLILFIPFLFLTWSFYKDLSTEEVFYSMGITWLTKKFSNNSIIMDFTSEE